MTVFTNLEVNEILGLSNSYLELLILQDYMSENRIYFSISFYKEITRSISKKFSSTFLNIKHESITN